MSVRPFLEEVNTLLGGGSSPYTIPGIVGTLYDLNSAFTGGFVSRLANNHLRLPPFVNGDFTTLTQASWGETPCGGNAAALLASNYATVYAGTGGVFEVGTPGFLGNSMQFTGAGPLLAYLPASGADGRLLGNYVNPTTTNAGGFGGEVAALKLNIDFADAGLLGNSAVAFGDLVLYGLTIPNQTEFNGQTVRQFFGNANFSIGTPVAADVSHFNAVAEALNSAFAYGYLSDWAASHLRLAGDFNFDGTVDAADYTVWRNGFGITYNTAHYDSWRASFGRTLVFGSGTGGASGTQATVPEPGALILLGMSPLGIIGFAYRRRFAALATQRRVIQQ